MDKEIEHKYLASMSEGDTASFDALFLIYYPRLLTFIDSLVKNRDDAKDISQDIFLKLWNNREKMPQVTSLKSYLFQMAKNGVYDYFKHHTSYDDYNEIQEYGDIGIDSVSNEVETRDLELLIDIVIENMPSQRKTIFIMSRKEGFSNDEISQKLNISKRTVETHISSALNDIRKLISQINLFFL